MTSVHIAAIIKDEHSDIREWIVHNEMIGVERITLYDNNSSHGYDKELGDYIRRGYVEMVLFPSQESFRQRAVYNDFCFTRRWSDDDWCAFIDPDEFIHLDRHVSISALIDDFSDCAGLVLSWQCYGADGWIERPDMPVQQAYVKPAPEVRDHHNYKTIARLSDVAFWNSVHGFTPKNGRHVRNTRRQIVMGEKIPKVLDVAYIKHYITKSWKDYVWRLERGNITPGIRKIETFFDYNPDMKSMRQKLVRNVDVLRFKTMQSDKDIEALNHALSTSDVFFRLDDLADTEDLSDEAFGQFCVLELINYCTMQLRKHQFSDPERQAAIARRFHDIVDAQIGFLNRIPRDTPNYRTEVVGAIKNTPFHKELSNGRLDR